MDEKIKEYEYLNNLYKFYEDMTERSKRMAENITGQANRSRDRMNVEVNHNWPSALSDRSSLINFAERNEQLMTEYETRKKEIEARIDKLKKKGIFY